MNQTVKELNKSLHQQMLDSGFRFVRKNDLEYFEAPDGKYQPYPPGYIRGPHYTANGSPRPWTMSVQGTDGWHQQSFTSQEHTTGEDIAWAVKCSEKVQQTTHA